MLFYLVLFPLYLKNGFCLTETKHMSGGVFGWADALKAQRNLWGGINFGGKIKLYKSEINVSEFVQEVFLKDIDFNLTKTIEDIMNSIQDNIDENDESDVSNERINANKIFKTVFSSIKNSIRNIHLHYSYDGDEDYPPYDGYTPPYDEPKQECDAKDYPNANTIGILFDNLNCSRNDEILGQLFSYALIIVPIIVIFVLEILFYIVFCFGCCCCCRAKDRYNPGIVSIIFFAVITAFTLIAVIFHIVGAVYLINIINYLTSDKVFDELDELVSESVPTVNSALSQSTQKFVPAVKGIGNDVVDTIDGSLPELLTILKSISGSFDSIQKFVNGFTDNINENKKTVNENHNKFQLLYNNEGNYRTDEGYEYCSVIADQNLPISDIDDDSISSELNSIKQMVENIDEVLKISENADSLKGDLKSAIDSMADDIDAKFDNITTEDVNEIINVSQYREDLDINELLKDYKWALPLAKALLFFFSFLMLVVLALQVCAFWTKNCCSRCVVGCCCPCCCCVWCQFFFGLFTTLGAIFMIIINIIYDQGDDVVDRFLKNALNEEKTIHFGSIDLSGISQNAIKQISIPDVKVQKIEFIKNFVDAKLGCKLSDILSFNQLPLSDIIGNVSEGIKTTTLNNEKLSVPIDNAINDLTADYLDSNNFITNIVDISQMKGLVTTLFEKINGCLTTQGEGTCRTTRDALQESYKNLFDDFDKKTEVEFPETRKSVKADIDNTKNSFLSSIDKVFNGLLTTIGSTLNDSLNLILSIFEDVDASVIVGIFNVFRVKLARNAIGYLMAVSISAHLYLVGLWAMQILLWVRRKGMGKTAKNVPVSYSYSYSYSYSDDNRGKKKKKRRERDLSDNENSSAGIELHSDVESVKEDSEMQRDVSVTEKDTDEEMNYINPYRHDTSSDNDNNDIQFHDSETIPTTDNDTNNYQDDESARNQSGSNRKIDEGFESDHSTQNNENLSINNDTESQEPKIVEDELSFNNQSENNNNNESNRSHSDNNSNNDDDDDDNQVTFVF